MEQLIKILDELQEQYSSRSMVLKLSDPLITDHERGKVAGNIEMLTKINLRLAEGDKNAEES